MAVGLVVFTPQSAIGIVVQEITEDLFAIGSVLHRVENVVVPKNIDVESWRDLLLGKLFQEVQESAVFKFHFVDLFKRPAFTRLFVHQFYLDWVEIQCGDYVEFCN